MEQSILLMPLTLAAVKRDDVGVVPDDGSGSACH